MTDYKEVIKQEEYNFIRENKHLGENLCLLAMGGSIAYGTNIETSDIDIRGIALNTTRQIFNLEKDFEQVVDSATDTVIYSINKMNDLLLKCNPNTLEILGCRPEHYLKLDRAGKLILANADNYLSIKAIDSFGGYANSQYNRLEHELLGNGHNDDKKLQMLKHSLQRSLESFSSMHKDLGVEIELKMIEKDEFEKLFKAREISDTSNERIVVNGKFSNVPVTDFKAIIGQIHKIQSEYGNINKRNTKKTDIKLAKHMMHLIRLYFMGMDLNEKGKVITYQEGDRHELLMSIRNGEFMHKNGERVLPEFYELLHKVQTDYDYSLKNTVLPEKPNYEAIDEMMIDIYKNIIA